MEARRKEQSWRPTHFSPGEPLSAGEPHSAGQQERPATPERRFEPGSLQMLLSLMLVYNSLCVLHGVLREDDLSLGHLRLSPLAKTLDACECWGQACRRNTWRYGRRPYSVLRRACGARPNNVLSHNFSPNGRVQIFATCVRLPLFLTSILSL